MVSDYKSDVFDFRYTSNCVLNYADLNGSNRSVTLDGRNDERSCIVVRKIDLPYRYVRNIFEGLPKY